MIQILNEAHFTRVVTFAHDTGQLAHLLDRLWYLHTYGDRIHYPEIAPHSDPLDWKPAVGGQCKVYLSYDSAPASFGLEWVGRVNGMFGGLIYHGSQVGWSADGRYQDPFSVRLCSDPNPWSVHT